MLAKLNVNGVSFLFYKFQWSELRSNVFHFNIFKKCLLEVKEIMRSDTTQSDSKE